MTFKNNRAPLLNNIKLYASFHHHMWIKTGVTVQKRLNGVMTSVTLTFDLWPWPFAWTSLLSLVITPEDFMMIRWWEHCQKGVTDGQTEIAILKAAWSQRKTLDSHLNFWKCTLTVEYIAVLRVATLIFAENKMDVNTAPLWFRDNIELSKSLN